MIVLDFPQYSEQWWAARSGKPTSSEFDKIITPAKLEASTSADGYMDKLLGEYFSGKPDETFQSVFMKNGKETEQEARDYYAFQFNCEPRQVGFCLHDSERYGCSPDMLLDGGGCELKCVIKGTLIKYHRKGVLPLEYKMQVLGSLLVTELDYWDFCAYNADLKPFQIKTERKDVLKELTAISDAVNRFCDKLEKEREILRSKFE
jgi:hypothetical protein